MKETPRARGALGNPGGQGAPVVRDTSNPAQTFASQGIDKNLAKQARKLSKMSEVEFEEYLENKKLTRTYIDAQKPAVTDLDILGHLHYVEIELRRMQGTFTPNVDAILEVLNSIEKLVRQLPSEKGKVICIR
jgi:hypothetical protein